MEEGGRKNDDIANITPELNEQDSRTPVVLIDEFGRNELRPDCGSFTAEKWNALKFLYIAFCMLYFYCELYLTIIIANITPELNEHPLLVDIFNGWWILLILCILEFGIVFYNFVRSLKNDSEEEKKCFVVFRGIIYSNFGLLYLSLNIFILHKVLVGRPQAWKHLKIEKIGKERSKRGRKWDALAPFSPLLSAL